jgi:hypothetical protein
LDAQKAQRESESPQFRKEMMKRTVGIFAEEIRERTGVACFAAFEEADMCSEIGIRHWAMYGGAHRGFAIGYSGTAEPFPSWGRTKLLFPVKYPEMRMQASLDEFDDWSDVKFWHALRAWSEVKARKAWGEEKEWRLILPLGIDVPNALLVHEQGEKGRTNHYLKIWDGDHDEERATKARLINRVILGAMADGDLEKSVLDARKGAHLQHVEVWKARPCERDYRLVLDRLA